MAQIVKYRYLRGTGGSVAIVQSDDGKYIIQWGAYVDDGGNYIDSGYNAVVFDSYPEALEYFETYYNWR